MKIKWLEDAVEDLRALRQYIALDNPPAANDVARKILNSIELLQEQPWIGRPGRIKGTRELIISNMPYIIPYRVKDSFIEILRVFHAARQWPEAI